jgi:hypothetical protein
MTRTQVGFALDSWADIALILGVGLALAAAPLLILAPSLQRQRQEQPGSLADRLRINLAVLRYDAWLDLRGGVGGRRRRQLRRELRANLVDAAAQVGSRDAIRRLGPLRQLAAEAAEATRTTADSRARPAWGHGAAVAAQAFAVILLLELLAVMWWTGAAHDSGAPTVRGSLRLFPGSAVEYSRLTGGASLEFQPGWLVLAAAAVTFAVASRPWLLARRRTS